METAIRDARTMSGPKPLSTPEEVEAYWAAHVAQHGVPERARRGDSTTDLRVSDVEIAAWVDGGRWVTSCPSCRGGIAVWPGVMDRACCLGCGTVYRVLTPEPAERDAAERVLADRPEAVRAWFPHRGETVDDLKAENITHGYGVGSGTSTEAQQIAHGLGGTVAPDVVERILAEAKRLRA